MGRQRSREETHSTMSGSSQSEKDRNSTGKLQKSPKEKVMKGGKKALDDIDEQIKNLMDKKSGKLTLNFVFKDTNLCFPSKKLTIVSSIVIKMNKYLKSKLRQIYVNSSESNEVLVKFAIITGIRIRFACQIM